MQNHITAQDVALQIFYFCTKIQMYIRDYKCEIRMYRCVMLHWQQCIGYIPSLL